MLIIVMMVMVLLVSVTAAAVMFFFHLRQIYRYLSLALHSLHQLCSGQLIPGRCDNGSICIMLPKHFYRSIQLLLRNHICTGQNDSRCSFNLIVIELAKVFHINFHLAGIYNGNGAIQSNIIIGYLFHSSNHIGKLTNTGGFNHNPIGIIIADHLSQSLTKITNKAAANTTGVHLRDIDPCIL